MLRTKIATTIRDHQLNERRAVRAGGVRWGRVQPLGDVWDGGGVAEVGGAGEDGSLDRAFGAAWGARPATRDPSVRSVFGETWPLS
jgi:hypothetical protein